jgi:CHASE3 domain sensor protein
MKQLFMFSLLMLFLLIAGTMDYQDEQMLISDYCDQVAQGAWPNYKNIDCSK